MVTELNPQGDPRLLSPLALAFLGDGVYELLAREHLLALGNAPVGRLHARTVELVSANAQAEAYGRIAPSLTPEEEAVFRRGRNANSTKCPKHTDPAVYRRATGVEALFGWLYLTGQTARANRLFAEILAGCEEKEGKETDEREE